MREPNVHRVLATGILLLTIVVAVWRIVATYSTFNHTYDEPFHFVRGLVWLTGQEYRHVEQPPLADAVIAAGPYLLGGVLPTTGDKIRDGQKLLYGGNGYFRILGSGRCGNLLFLLVSVAGVWYWEKQDSNRLQSALGVLFLTNLPPVLGHAAVATSDVAIMALFTWFLLVLERWLAERTPKRAVHLGLVMGMTLLTKFSALLLLPIALLAVMPVYVAIAGSAHVDLRRQGADLFLVVLLAGLIVWIGYRGSVGYVIRPSEHQSFLEFRESSHPDGGKISTLERLLTSRPLPAPEFFEGILWSLRKAEHGHAPYFLGKPRHNHGSWLFFPVVLAVKTPVPYLLLSVAGAIVGIRKQCEKRKLGRYISFVVPFAVLVAVAPSSINLGVRHMLPLYPLLAINAAQGFVCLWDMQAFKRLWRVVACAILFWTVVEVALAHPDYLSYFNQMACGHPERIVVDSDLDWGQDLHRLGNELRRRGINEVSIAYFGSARIECHTQAVTHRLQPHQRASGWIAVSITLMQTQDGYEWLTHCVPVATVGRSIRLYYVHS